MGWLSSHLCARAFRPPTPRRARPTLEVLEARLVPSGSVTTYRYGPDLTGQNLSETALTPANVGPTTFGQLFKAPTDGATYAQPLHLSGLVIAGAAHDVVFVATEADSVYAIDAHTGTRLWMQSLLRPGERPLTGNDFGLGTAAPVAGITSTPVIDPVTATLYVLTVSTSAAPNGVASGANSYQRLHALDVATGTEKLGEPATIAATVNGTGTGADPEGHIAFDAFIQHQRSALTLAGGVVYIAWASHGDSGAYHGWIMGYRASDLRQVAVFNDTPNGEEGGIWMGGAGPSVDAQGYLYVSVGNGTFDTTLDAAGFPSRGDYGQSVLKLAVDPTSTPDNPTLNGWGLKVVDYFTPSNEQQLDDFDLDVGSGGVVLLPDSAGNTEHPHLLVTGDKADQIFLIDRDHMGHFDPNADHNVQTLDTAHGAQGVFSTFGYFNGVVYAAGVSDALRAYAIVNATLTPLAASVSPDVFLYPGASPMVSANGSVNGVIWALDRGTYQLRAYSAANLSTELYTSGMAANDRDLLGTIVQFEVPVVVDGEVFVATTTGLVAYGLLDGQTPPATPTGVTAVGVSSTQVWVRWAIGGPNVSGYRIEASLHGLSYDIIGTVSGSTTGFVEDNLTPGLTYFFRVVALNSAGESDPSTAVTATSLADDDGAPATPDYLLNQVYNNVGPTVLLFWASVPGATEYVLERRTGPTGSYQPLVFFAADATFYDGDQTVQPGGEYFYRIQAIDDAGWSAPTFGSAIEVPTLPAVPTGARADVTSSAIALTWQDDAAHIDGINIFRKDGGTGIFVPIATLGPDATSYVDNFALLPNTRYDYHIQAFNVVGASDFTGVTVVTVPLPPDPVTATAGAGQVALSWTAAAGASGYNVYRATTSGGPYDLVAAGVTDVSWVDAGLPSGVTFYYIVTATNAWGESDWSQEVAATPM